MCSNNATARGNASNSLLARAAVTARAVKVLSALFFAALLAACAGPLPFKSAPGVENEQQAVATQVAPESARKKRVRTQDVLAEWGTFGIEPRAFRKAGRAASPRTLLPAPDYSESIQDIVDNATCHSCDAKPYHHMVVNASLRHGVPPSLIHAVIQKESGYNPKARSKKNARGLMQVTPGTAKFVGVVNAHALFDPQTNIHAGTAYLKYLMRTHATFDEVLAAYNSGPGNVRKYNGVPPFNETRRYVRDVRKFYAASSGDEP
ncbi:lytic transglycosylase domain-containing protein [Noviherbaspirillum sp. ST9]|uniref:lytic transglycosylase domain-containing protein n=1 Tax=Noviherbaspirillum sp. ST9 TaxID=3401606 RepID=UPI003B586AFD